MTNTEHRSQLETEGFTVIPNLLSDAVVRRLQKVLRDSFDDKPSVPMLLGRAIPNAATLIPELSEFIAHPGLLDHLSEIFDGEEFSFTSHCDAHLALLSGWHKDDGTSGGRAGYFEEPAYDYDNCRVYKVGIYLQDHDKDNAGLSVRPGSHRNPEVSFGEDYYIPSKAGDAIIFDVRINHAGQLHPMGSPRAQKMFDRINCRLPAKHRERFKVVAKATYDAMVGKRMALFFTFGVNNELTDRFAINNMRRQIEQNSGTSITLPEETASALRKAGVGLSEKTLLDAIH